MSIIVVCIPLVFRMRAVIAGWVKGVRGICSGGDGLLGGVSGSMGRGVMVGWVGGWVFKC